MTRTNDTKRVVTTRIVRERLSTWAVIIDCGGEEWRGEASKGLFCSDWWRGAWKEMREKRWGSLWERKRRSDRERRGIGKGVGRERDKD